jgi:hypothetical protein
MPNKHGEGEMDKLLPCPFCGGDVAQLDTNQFHCVNAECVLAGFPICSTVGHARRLWNRRAAQGWQDISTAPKDGEPFIYQDSDEAVSTCSWQSDDCGYSWWDIAGDQIAYPVRWMPLPPVHIADQRGEK